MSKLSKFTFRVAAASVIAIMPASPSLADPRGMLTDVRPHQHILVTPSGNQVSIGPDLCANPDLQDAFNQFHYNVHHSASRPGSDIETLGPQHGAPGLHDGQGAELRPGGC